MTEEERRAFVEFRESPRPIRWLFNSLMVGLVFAGVCGGLLGQVAKGLITYKPTALSVAFGLAFACSSVVWVWAAVIERRSRRRRAAQRAAAAATGVVEVTEIQFDKLWTVSGTVPGITEVILELRPFFLVRLAVPRDEDDHAIAAQSVGAPFMPKPTFNGTFPRQRVTLEHVLLRGSHGGPDRSVEEQHWVPLSIVWLGERMPSAGMVPSAALPRENYDMMDWAEVSHLDGLVHTVPQLARGPWMYEHPNATT